jgi:aryl-alcohol dehydrogenase-like predicted oxidoreductase
MEYRQLGRSGLRISKLTMGTMTFGGRGNFRTVGTTDLDGARRQIDMAMDAGVNLIDTADIYSGGAAEWTEPPIYDEDKLYDTIEVVVEIAEARGVSPAQVALAWLLDRPGITSVIVGARTDEQLADNLAAASLALSPEETARLEAVSRPPLIYPFWHQLGSASDRLGEADLSLIAPYLEG